MDPYFRTNSACQERPSYHDLLDTKLFLKEVKANNFLFVDVDPELLVSIHK